METDERKFHISGMSCASCAARVEQAVKTLPGIDAVNVSLLLNEAVISGTASDSEIIFAVKNIGYGAKRKEAENNGEFLKSLTENDEFRKLRKRFLISLLLYLPLFYLTSGQDVFHFPVPEFLTDKWINGLMQFILAAAILLLNREFFIRGFRGLFHKSPNMDTLVSLGSGISFAYSAAVYVFQLNAMPFYFGSSAMILVLITLGKSLEAKSKGKTAESIRNLETLIPPEVTILRDGEENIIPVSSLRKDDVFILRPGESIPADGVILSGISEVDESSLRGEPIPREVHAGDSVSAGTINGTGVLTCKVERAGTETLLSSIIETVLLANEKKAPLQRVADKISLYFVPTVMVLSLLTFILFLIFTSDFQEALKHAVSVLVVSCPCAMGLATPLAIMVGSGIGAERGILFRSGEALENAGRMKKIAFDKTGTVTVGHPFVQKILPFGSRTENEFLSLIASLESHSEHPLSKAVTDYAKENAVVFHPESVQNVRSVPGSGIRGNTETGFIFGGSKKTIDGLTEIPADFEKEMEASVRLGMTPLYFSTEDEFLGGVLVSDRLKPDAKEVFQKLLSDDYSLLLLSGDRKEAVGHIANELGIRRFYGELLPEEKMNYLDSETMMIGDGINDAPAMQSAGIGVSYFTGSDITVHNSDIVLLRENTGALLDVLRISKAVRKNIMENLFWAFFYNILLIPLASGILTPVLHFSLTPGLSALAMSLSSLTVCLNALRLRITYRYCRERSLSACRK